MSVTITISGNRKFCQDNNLVGKLEYNCQTCEFDGNKPTCRECGGSGKVCFEDLPFEMNVTNGNFNRLWEILGITFSYSGTVNALTLLNKLANTSASKMVSTWWCEETELEYYATTPDQAQSYFDRLAQIAAEAMKRNQVIVWG